MRYLVFVLVFLFFTGINLSYADDVNFNELSNCGEWKLTGWHYDSDIVFEYRGETVYLAEKHYGCRNNSGYHTVDLFYRPVVDKELESLINHPDFKSKSLQLAESKGSWFLFYKFAPADIAKTQSVHLYERARKWYEFYRAWQPRWRFVIDWENTLKTWKEVDDFMSKKFGLDPAR